MGGERAVVFDRYLAMVEAAVASNDTAELGNLLAIAAYWNRNPSIRPRLTEAANKAASIESLSLPEKRVNPIAAEIYTQIDLFRWDNRDIHIAFSTKDDKSEEDTADKKNFKKNYKEFIRPLIGNETEDGLLYRVTPKLIGSMKGYWRKTDNNVVKHDENDKL